MTIETEAELQQATYPDGEVHECETENVTTDLTDEEIELVVVGLNRIAKAAAHVVHNLQDVAAAIALLSKLGFPFEKPLLTLRTPQEIGDLYPTTVLPEGETEHPVPNDDGPVQETR